MHPTDSIFRLIVNAKGILGDFCHIIIFNGFNELVKKGYGNINIILPKGIYRVRLELNEESKEEMVRLDQDVHLDMDPPKSHSSIVADDFSSSHDYYSCEAIKWSREATANAQEKGLWSAIFLFLRYPNKELAQQLNPDKSSLGRHFSLLDAQRKKIFTLTGSNIREDPHTGWLAFHVPLKNGQYYLHYSGKGKREIPIYAFNGWQSQLFLTMREEPLFPTLKISTDRITAGFRNDNLINYIMDASMQKMHNGIYFIPEKILEKLALGNWDNPMMGLLTAYVYFKSNKRDKDDLFRQLLNNYDRIILDDQQAPDLLALKLMAARYFNDSLPDYKLSAPCMFMTGMKLAWEFAEQNVDIVDDNSFLELIVKKIYADMEWTSYEPPALGVITNTLAKL